MFDKLTKAASIVPVLAAIYFTCRGFIGLGMSAELVAILTITLASLSWLLSQTILRFLEVKHNKYMATTVIVLGIAFLITEASFAHVGLEWMLKQGSLTVPAWAIWFFSIALSITNVFAKWAFIGEPGEAKTKDSKPVLATENGKPVPALDPKDERTLGQIAEQITA